ncbi:hypothetical protein [Paucisalibacillus globulus]|uniref:hypothetical protein n=1 Tax=Paucisalibacillus globulus TaxID=351095 RepID=UPI0012EBBBFD|nr:hypothetical protein [Paucisalibacillus globulus]
MEEEYRFQQNRKGTWKLVVLVGAIFLFFIIASILDDGQVTRETLYISLFGVLFLSLLLLKGFNTKVLMYNHFLIYRYTFSKHSIDYSEIAKVTRETREVGSGEDRKQNFYFAFYRGDGSEIVAIKVGLFGEADNQTQFLKAIHQKNPSITFDEACLYIMQGTEEFKYINDVIGRKIGGIFQWIVIGIIIVGFSVPLLLFGLVKLLEKFL